MTVPTAKKEEENMEISNQIETLNWMVDDLVRKNQGMEKLLAELEMQNVQLNRLIGALTENGLHLSNLHFEIEARIEALNQAVDTVGIILDSHSQRLDGLEMKREKKDGAVDFDPTDAEQADNAPLPDYVGMDR
jgi:chromosome segregation ATPase